MDEPVDSHWPPPTTIFGHMLDSPKERQEKMPTAVGIPQQNKMPMLQGRPSPFTSSQPSICSPGIPSLPAVSPTRVLAVRQYTKPTQSLMDTAVNTETSEPTQPDGKTSTDVATIGKMTPRVSSLNTSRIIRDDSTGAMYLDVIATSMEWMVIGCMEPKEGPTIRDITDKL